MRIIFKFQYQLLAILSETQIDGRIPARIIKIDPEGSVDLPERSVGFEFECVVEGSPTPQVTWATGIQMDSNLSK